MLNHQETALFLTRLAQGTTVEVFESHGLGLRVTRDVQQGEVLLQEKALCVISLRDDASSFAPRNYKGSSPSAAVRAKTLFEERVQGASKRFRAHRRQLEAEGLLWVLDFIP